MSTSASCLFCKLRDGQIPATISYRDEDVIAFPDIKPQADFHELVIPTRHIASLADAQPGDDALFGKLMRVAAQRVRDRGFADGFRVVMNAGADAGQTVFHAHLHVLAGRPMSWPPG
ncbi:MAG TPA: histidine triad nucleotide-binding protein [Polyangia bacterium]